ncbi:MAG: hypothetical protein GY830_01150 [Bacteroidetes bacterium]|nr:hypothetical protein [Bacteroidota bacterium]
MIKDHMGRMVKEAIKKNGKTVTQVANELGVSRNTLYNKFKLPYLRSDFMIRLGHVLGYDFSKKLSYLKEFSENFDSFIIEEVNINDTNFSKKYFLLLEKYNQLLMFLLRISNTKNTESVKEEVNTFVKKNLIYNSN